MTLIGYTQRVGFYTGQQRINQKVDMAAKEYDSLVKSVTFSFILHSQPILLVVVVLLQASPMGTNKISGNAMNSGHRHRARCSSRKAPSTQLSVL
jgi:hypothetical protein